jgi:hypothetical protein
LRSESLIEIPGLTTANRGIQWHIEIRNPEVTIIFRDLVFQDQMVTKCIPREIG